MQHPILSEEDIRFVADLAREAGRLAVDMRPNVGIHEKSGPDDLVTDADIAVSKLICDALRQRFPNDVIVSEEDKPGDNKISEAARKRAWVLDPIDGTIHYIKQDGNYTIMIGLIADGVAHYGWMFQPSTDTLFHGGVDRGAWKCVGNNEPIRYPESRRVEEKLPVRLMMGSDDKKQNPWLNERSDISLVKSTSLGLKIVKIFEDEADLFVSLSGWVKLWDTAAPAAMARGGGFDVATITGEQLPYPLPNIHHGTSVIIGRPGAQEWVKQTFTPELATKNSF